MINTKQGVWLLGVLGFIMVVLVGILIFVPGKKSAPLSVSGIEITSPEVNVGVSSPIEITGTVTGDGWGGFEGQVGTVLLLTPDAIGLAHGVLEATTDWTKLPTEFQATLTFPSAYKGPATLSFRNENPSGMPEKDKYLVLPIIIK
jgi:hypothetical protein